MRVRTGRIGNRQTGVMGYTYGDDAVEQSNPNGRDYSFCDAREEWAFYAHRSVRAKPRGQVLSFSVRGVRPGVREGLEGVRF